MELFWQRSVNRLRSLPRKLTVAITAASAHTALATHAGLSQEDITQALEGRAADPAVRFAKVLLEKHGDISDSDFNQVKQAGLSDYLSSAYLEEISIIAWFAPS
jgi:alkylhydroperoxidase family enzyme